MHDERANLEKFDRYLRERCAAMAPQMDCDPTFVREICDAFKSQGGLTVRILSTEGGTFLLEQGFTTFRMQRVFAYSDD
jgi:hypothetical protein